MSTQYNLNQLRWQCRRGIKEVEMILGPFFERSFEQLDDGLKKDFVALLQCYDAELFEWLTIRNYPESEPLYDIIQKIFLSMESNTTP